jgi:hypothetical protein
MTLAEQIEKDYLEAYKSKDEAKTSLLRMLKSSIQNAKIAQKSDLSDQDTIKIIQREVKQRIDAIEDYKKGGRADLAEKESKEIEYLKIYLPKELSDQELELIIKEGISQTGATGPSDFGKVMGATMPKIAGRATGDRVSQILKRLLQ